MTSCTKICVAGVHHLVLAMVLQSFGEMAAPLSFSWHTATFTFLRNRTSIVLIFPHVHGATKTHETLGELFFIDRLIPKRIWCPWWFDWGSGPRDKIGPYSTNWKRTYTQGRQQISLKCGTDVFEYPQAELEHCTIDHHRGSQQNINSSFPCIACSEIVPSPLYASISSHITEPLDNSKYTRHSRGKRRSKV